MEVRQFKTKVNQDRTIKLPEGLNIDEGSEVKVILTKGEEDVSSSDIARLLEASNSFDFLESEDEDIYSQDDLKVKY